MVFKAVPEPMPQNTGWLSFALYEDQIWLDKKFLGQGVIAYMRVGSGRRAVELRHPKWGVESFVLNVRHGQHLTVVRRAKRVGVGQVRGEQSYVSVRRYQSGQAPSEEIRDPGPYCIKQDDCPFLTPGEQLYISPDGSYQIMPSINSTMAVRPYRANSDDGFLTLYSYPPGALFINDKLYAMSPVARLPLRPGNYQVYIRNGFMDMEWRGKVNIISGNEQRQVVSLYPKGGSNLQIMSVAPAQIYINQLYRGWTPLRVMPLVAGKHHVYLLRPNGQNKTWHVSLKPNSIHTLKWLSDAPPNPTNSPTDPTDAPPTK
jgi:hypothetical protein